MKIEYVPIKSVKLNPANPRTIKDDSFKRLVKSLEECPDLFKARPLLCSKRTGKLIVIGGNMRLRAAKELKYAEVPIIIMEGITEDQEKEVAIKDNGAFGEWDYEALANEWSHLPLKEWGVTIRDDWDIDSPEIGLDESEPNYSRKIEAPVYEPSGECPKIKDLLDESKTRTLREEIEATDIPKDVKAFLNKAADRHTIFHFQNIADYYAHAPATIQRLMEKSALVIIDFDKAIENGFVLFSKEMAEIVGREFNDA